MERNEMLGTQQKNHGHVKGKVYNWEVDDFGKW